MDWSKRVRAGSGRGLLPSLFLPVRGHGKARAKGFGRATVEGSTWERNTRARQRFQTEHPAGRAQRRSRLEVSDHTAASVLGIEIANEVRKSGTRLDPIIIGMLSRPFTRRNFDSGQLLRA